ncbi:MAG: hypothetical protein KUG50_04570 [Cycloclasticus sp.]|nr:hypothetical protein [Cycloclasticus sp.]
MKLFKKKQFMLEMGFSRKEFISLLNSQKKLIYKQDESTITFTLSGQCARIILEHEGTSRLGSARLPMLLVSFDFSDMADLEQEQFMDVFLLKFQRGGG